MIPAARIHSDMQFELLERRQHLCRAIEMTTLGTGVNPIFRLISRCNVAYIAFSMSLTKEKISGEISRKCKIPKTEAGRLLESLMEQIKSTLASGEDVLITGFGKFRVSDKKARRGRNPQNAEELLLDARRVVRFYCSDVLKGRLNKKE